VELSLSDSVTISSSVVFRHLSGETVLLNLDSGIYYGLDAVGTRIWQLLAESLPLVTVCSTIQKEYAVEPDVIERDVLKLVRNLYDKRLVTRRTA
jgi:hypothetical protein